MPSENEEEYFARIEFAKRKEAAAKAAAERSSQELAALKDTHWMHCPKCGHDLVTVSLQGVQVDTCSSCQGMWLDAGELDGMLKSQDKGLLGRFKSVFGG